jgi:DNA-directed RNA polymerase subunit B
MTTLGLLEKYINNGSILKTVTEYDRTPWAELFRKTIGSLAGSKNCIDSFNNWVENILPKQIIEKSFISPSGVKVTFSDVFLNKPVHVINNKEEPLYPAQCRIYHKPYAGKLELTCTTEKGKDKRIIRVNLGNVPIMLGSCKCNLYNKNPSELVELGECITDPFGYFILSKEWALVTHDKLRHNLPIISIKKKISSKPVLKIQYDISKYHQLSLDKQTNSIYFKDPISKDETNNNIFPIFVIFKIITGFEPDKIINDYIFRFIKPELHRRAKNVLQYSIFDYNTIPNPILSVYNNRNEHKNIKEEDKKNIKEEIINNFEKDIFENLKHENKETQKEMKIIMLSYLVAKYVLFILGKINLDNQDSWKNKRFDNGAKHMEGLFNGILNNLLKKCQKKKGTKETIDNYINFGEYLNSKSKDELKKNFEASFNTTSWGVNEQNFDKKNYRELVRRDNPLALWSQIVKNMNSSSVKGASKTVRVIQSTQRNHHCIIETPEGINVGIVKYNCLTGIFSLTRDEQIIKDFLYKFAVKYQNNKEYYLILVNGMPCVNKEEIIYADKKIIAKLVEAKRSKTIPFDSEITLNEDLKIISIFCDSSRAIAPYLIVNQKTNKLVIEEKKAWGMEFDELTSNGCIEFLSSYEEDNPEIIIAASVNRFYETRKEINAADEKTAAILKRNYAYSHCSIDPLQSYSLPTSTCPMFNHQTAPRTCFQASMAKQALGFYNINYHLRYEKGFKQLYKGERSLTETDTYFLPGMDIFPSGQIANVAFLCDTDNQEDAVIVSEDFINAGNLNFIKYQVYSACIITNTKAFTIEFKKPPLKYNEDPHIYRHIQENGLPKLDSLIEPGDCILGKVKTTAEGETNDSVFAELDLKGYVDRITVTRDRNTRNPIIRIKLRTYNKYQAGDKLALRYAQKGTIGIVAKREDLPVVSSGPNKGIVPDILFNPHGFPSRQTAGLLLEGLLTKASIYTGKRVDVSAFRKNDLKEAMQVLKDNGLDENGYEEMETSKGIKLPNKVCLVPLYEQVLKHQADDKIQFRTTGARDFVTHQPRKGRSRGGGLKVGEMEKDSFAAHGASAILNERMMKSSDEFKLIVCNNCGIIINYKFCTMCENSDPVAILVPYVFKLLIRLLNAMGIDFRLKTKKINELTQ